jgi:hypothetical protein
VEEKEEEEGRERGICEVFLTYAKNKAEYFGEFVDSVFGNSDYRPP